MVLAGREERHEDLLQNEDLPRGCYIKDLKPKLCKKPTASLSKTNINFRLRTTKSNLAADPNSLPKVSFTLLLGNGWWPMLKITWGRWRVCLVQSDDIYLDTQAHLFTAFRSHSERIAKIFSIALDLTANNVKMDYKVLTTSHNLLPVE